MSEADARERHRKHVVRLSRPGAALSVGAPTSTTLNPRWFRERDGVPVPRAARIDLHNRLISTELAASSQAKYERFAIITAGPPGAGKGTVLDRVLQRRRSDFLVIDPDVFKHHLLQEALDDGSYHSWIKPDSVRAAEAGGEEFDPLELSALVHAESSMLAKNLRRRALADGRNIVVDTVLSSASSAFALCSELQNNDYSAEILDVEVPFELSAQRIDERWQRSFDQAREYGLGLGGRWVPSEYTREVFAGPSGKSRSEHVAKVLANGCPIVRRYRVHRTVAGNVDVAGHDLEPHGQWSAGWTVDKRREVSGGPLTNAIHDAAE
ncbi:zeta toxin family protein [Mycetocola saprophilus]|uniref:zeta toxin family protein n=1 Tax=Mycetocola saprophilus TaxID=76636 RepID=UPI003BF0721D